MTDLAPTSPTAPAAAIRRWPAALAAACIADSRQPRYFDLRAGQVTARNRRSQSKPLKNSVISVFSVAN